MKKLFPFTFFIILIIIALLSAGIYKPQSDNSGFFYSNRFSVSSFPVQNSTETDFIPGMTTGASMPVYCYHAANFSYARNDTGWVYIVGGDLTGSGTLTTKNDRYNVNTNSWQTMAPYPVGPGIWYTTGCTVKDTGYVCGGLTGNQLSNITANVNAYNINANTWSARAPMPAPRAMVRAVSYQDSLIYAAGGFDQAGNPQPNVYLYNAVTNSWRQATPLPYQKMGGAFARSGDTLVYVNGNFSGLINATYAGVISQTDRSVISWTSKALYPGTAFYRQDAQNWGCRGIIISGGASAQSYLPAVNECYIYSPGADTWIVQPSLITSRTAHMTGSVKLANNVWKFVNVCGFNGANVLTTDILTDTLCNPLGVSNNNGQIPDTYTLWQNYPNPFNPTTKITYALPKAEIVKLVVYDILGREVKSLINEYKTPGTYEISFDGSNLSSGVYFYKIETRNFADTRKMLLIK